MNHHHRANELGIKYVNTGEYQPLRKMSLKLLPCQLGEIEIAPNLITCFKGNGYLPPLVVVINDTLELDGCRMVDVDVPGFLNFDEIRRFCKL